MRATPDSVTFGSVPIGQTASATVSLVNEGATPVQISQVNASGQPFSIVGPSNLPATVAAGDTLSLTVQFNPAAAGIAIGHLTLASNSSIGTQVVDLSGTGMAAPSPAALSTIVCASSAMTGASLSTCTVTLTAPATADGLTVNLSSSSSAVTIPSTVTLPANTSSANFAVNVAAVTSTQAATVTATAGSVAKNFILQLNAVTPALKISAASLAFGNVVVNTAATPQPVTLTSTGTSPVIVSAAAVTGTGFKISGITFPVTLNPGQAVTFNVSFNPTTAVAATGQLTISSNSSTNPTAVIPLSGTGMPVPATLSALSCSSGTITGASTDACTVTLTAAAPSGGTSIGLSSSNSAVTVPGVVTVPANATGVSFTATVTSVATAQAVTITASSGSVSRTFALQLNAATPALKISTSSLAFGNVVVNTAATLQPVTLTSTGTSPVIVSAAAVTGTGFKISGGTFPMTLNPGQATTLNVAFNPATAGAATGQLTITSNSSTNPTAVIPLSGTGMPVPAALNALSCSSGTMTGSGTDACTVTLTAAAPNGGMSISLSSSNSAVTVPGAVTMPANATGAGFTATVTSVSTAQAVSLTASSGGVSRTYALQLNAATAALRISAASLAFGNVVVNAAATPQPVTLTSTGTAPLIVSAAAVTGTGFKISGGTFPMTLNLGQAATLNVTFNPTATGAATGQLTITSNATTNPTQVISLSGTGMPVPAALSAFSCSSGTMTGAGTDACTITLTAAAPSGGMTVSLSSSNSAVTVPGTVTVPASATSAGFTGTVTSVATAQAVTITASSGSVSRTFALQLNAATPALKISTSSLAFGNVVVNTAATPQPVTLTSTGTAPVIVSAASVTGTGFKISGGTFPLTLNPGQAATLNVAFSPTVASAATGQLTITSNSTTNPTAVISLSGTGTAVPGSLGTLQCSSGTITGSGTDACIVTLTAAAPSGGMTVRLSSSNPAVTVPGTVTVSANATSAGFTATVASVTTAQAVTMTASAGGVMKNFTLQLNATVLALTINATNVAFGDVVVNALATQSVTLTSIGNAPVTVSGARLTGTGFKMTGSAMPATLSPGQQATLDIQFNPLAVGAATGQLTVTSNSTTNGTAVIGLKGTGTAAPQTVAVVVTPNTASTPTGGNQQFAASVTGTSNTAVTWTASGTGCNGATCGAISSTGLYTAPAKVPSPATVAITATSVSDPRKSASASVTILQSPSIQLPTPTVSLLPAIFAPGISVALADTNTSAVVCYTTDGTSPMFSPAGACGSGTMTYTAPIVLMATTTIKALAVLPGTNEISNTLSATYTIQPGTNNTKLDQSLTLGGAQTAIATAGRTTAALVIDRSGGQTLWQLLPNPWGASTRYSGKTSVAYSGTGTITTTVAMGDLPNAPVNGYPLVFYGGDVWGGHIGDDAVVFPALLSQMGSLLVSVNYALNNTTTPANQDIAFDEWLTPTSPFSGAASGAVEVIICPYYKFSQQFPGPLVGTFTVNVLLNGVITPLQFNEYVEGHGPGAIVLFTPTMTQLPSANLQLNLLDFLQQGESLSGVSGWYVAGFDYGTEYGNSSAASYTLTTTKLGLSQMLRPASH